MNLEEKYKGNTIDGIFFTESEIKEPHEVLRNIKVDSVKMNANLKSVKEKMVKEAKAVSAIAIMNFKYGQKRSLLSLWDDTIWYGEGTAIKIKE